MLDVIDDQLGRELSNLVFHRKPLFHTLFTFYYGLLFGLNSPMRRASVKRLPGGTAEAARIASKRIASDSISEELAKVLRGGTNHLPARRKRLQFLTQVLNGVKSH